MDKHRLSEILAKFPGRRVLVVGDVLLDEYLLGDVNRVSPEAPVPIVELRQRTRAPGGAGNTAANIVALGGHAVLCGVVGSDEAADQLRDVLQKEGVATERLVIDPSRATITKTRVVAHSQQVVRIDCETRGGLAATVEEELFRSLVRCIAECEVCVISDYGKGIVSANLSQAIIRACRDAGTPVVVDPKGSDFRKYRGATVVTPNASEAMIGAGLGGVDSGDLCDLATALLQRLSGAALLITRGPQGMSLFRSQMPMLHFPTEARAVFDVTGAGDTVVAALSMAIATGAALEHAVQLANRAAARVVEKPGTATVTIAELAHDFASQNQSDAMQFAK